MTDMTWVWITHDYGGIGYYYRADNTPAQPAAPAVISQPGSAPAVPAGPWAPLPNGAGFYPVK